MWKWIIWHDSSSLSSEPAESDHEITNTSNFDGAACQYLTSP